MRCRSSARLPRGPARRREGRRRPRRPRRTGAPAARMRPGRRRMRAARGTQGSTTRWMRIPGTRWHSRPARWLRARDRSATTPRESRRQGPAARRGSGRDSFACVHMQISTTRITCRASAMVRTATRRWEPARLNQTSENPSVRYEDRQSEGATDTFALGLLDPPSPLRIDGGGAICTP